MLTPEQFKETSANLADLVNRQIDVTTASGIDATRQESKPSENLSDIKTRLEEGALNVLVMGKFSSGKSTFLNALMGKMLLPAKAIPTTAVIGEIQYSDEPEAILFPKEKYGDTPLNIKIEDLDKYIVIDHEETKEDVDKEENHYEKVIIRYPLSICKLGVTLVDSPGLDDPTCHDDITLNYLPTADAIVYCMNVQQAFSASDKMEIEHLRALGYKSIIFVLTYYDMLEQNDMLTGKNEAEVARRHYTNLLTPYTDLGTEGIFFVGSLPALMGKIRNDQNMLASSHMPEVEKKLEQILFNERGRLKLIKALYSAKKINRETGRYISDSLELLTQDRGALANNLTKAQANLNKAKEKSDLIAENFRRSTEEIISGTHARTREFFLSDVLPNIQKWTNEFKPAEGQEFKMWQPKRSGKIFGEACSAYLQKRIETASANWCQDELVPNYVFPELKKLAEAQETNMKAYEKDLNNIRTSLSLSIAPAEPQISGGSRVVSAIAGLLAGGPAGAAVGGVMGWEGLKTVFVSQIVLGIVLGIASLFTPISLPFAIVAVAVTSLAGGLAGSVNLEDKIRKKIAEQAKVELSKHQEEFVNGIANGVKSVVDKASAAVKESLYTPVAEYQKLLDDAQKDINAESKTIEKQIADKTKLKKDNEVLTDDMEDFGQEININL